MSKLMDFFKNETVFTISLILAIISCFFAFSIVILPPRFMELFAHNVVMGGEPAKPSHE